MSYSWPNVLRKELRHRSERALSRSRLSLSSPQHVTVSVAGNELVNFSSNDYLGFANNPELIAAAMKASQCWGVGSGASHLVCGHQEPHHDLESALADFVGAESALLFSSGYMANLALASSFADKGDLILQDKLNHASLIDGARLSRAMFKRYAHLDTEHAARLLGVNRYRRCVLMTDGVFSMDGDQAPLEALRDLLKPVDGLLIVDDAHGFGVCGELGRGTLSAVAMKPTGNVLLMATLGKALGSYGAFVAGDRVFIEHLLQTARSYIYTTALPASIAATSLAALQLLSAQGQQLLKALNENIAYFKHRAAALGLDIMASNTAIQPWLIGDAKDAIDAAAALTSAGFNVIAIRPPTVPDGTARLRVALSAEHSKQQIDSLIDQMRRIADG